MDHAMKPSRLLFLAGLVVLLPSSSCHDRHHHPDVVIVVESEQEPAVIELEPNDDAFSANYLGYLAPGDRVVIQGEIVDCCDPFDGFAFLSTDPLLVEVSLESFDGGDLDVCVYDPTIDDFSLCFENGGAFDGGSFEVLFGGAEFHTVVAPFDFGSRYTLTVDAYPLPYSKALGAEAEKGESNLRALDARDARELGVEDKRAKAYRAALIQGSSTQSREPVNTTR